MNELNFAYWLQGYFELSRVNGEVKLTQEQVNMIEQHLNLVFKRDYTVNIDLDEERQKLFIEKFKSNTQTTVLDQTIC